MPSQSTALDLAFGALSDPARRAMKRRFDASPQRVFRAFADSAAKAVWFTDAADMWQLIERVTDFRIGGREVLKGTWSQGAVTSFDAVYHDIVADQHILCGYNRLMDMRKLSLSLATIEIRAAAGGGAEPKVTEQGAFLDGFDDAGSRERGTGSWLDSLGAALR